MDEADTGARTPRGRSADRIGGRAAGVLAANGASVAIAFATSVAVARALGPDGRGVVAVLQTDALVLAALLGLGVPWALYYYASYSCEPQPELVGFSVVHAGLLAGAALAAAAIFGSMLAGAQEVPDGDLYLIAAWLVPATFLEYAYVDMLRGQRRSRMANRALVSGRALGLVAMLLLVVWLDLGVRGALVALIVASGAQALITLPALLRRGVALSRSSARKVLGYGVRVQVASVSRLLSRRFDVVVLSLFAPSVVVGHYAVAQSLAELTLLVPQAFGVTVGPLITGGEADRTVAQRVIRLNGTTALVGAVALAAAAPFAVGLAFGEAFEPAVLPLLILLPGAWMFACGEFVSHVMAARGLPGTASWLSAFQAGLTIALDLILVPPFGIEGAAIASAIAYTAYGLVSLAVVARQDGTSLMRLLVASPAELRRYRETVRGSWIRLRNSGG